jgi:hypothetical protein
MITSSNKASLEEAVAGGRPTRQSVHERLEHEVAALAKVGGLPAPEEAAEIWRSIWIFETHNSTALEGNTLLLRQVEVLLKRGDPVGGKPLKDYLEVEGYATAARTIYERARTGREGRLLTLQDVRETHHAAMAPVWAVAPHPDALPSEGPGNFRQHDLLPFMRGMQPPSFPLVHARMTSWVDETNRLRSATGPLCERVGAMHSAYERIHPFIDGNGRTGRLLMNLVLVTLGYPPAVIQKRERDTYLRALDLSDRGNHGPLGEIIARAVLDNIMRFLLPAIAGEVKLVPLEALADREVRMSALRQAAQLGRLEAKKNERGVWLSTKRWVAEYKRSRYAALREPRPRTRP